MYRNPFLFRKEKNQVIDENFRSISIGYLESCTLEFYVKIISLKYIFVLSLTFSVISVRRFCYYYCSFISFFSIDSQELLRIENIKVPQR